MSIMLSALPALYFLIVGINLSHLFKKDIGTTLPIGMFLSTLLLYVFGLFGILKLGVYLVVLATVIGFGWVIFQTRGRLKGVFTSSLLLYVLIVAVVIGMNTQRYFYQWDEFSHWGLMVKEMLRLNQFYSVDASHLVAHKDYPPIIATFEYFWIQGTRIYAEPFVYQGLQILGLSLFLPAFSALKKGKHAWTLVIVFLTTLVIFQGLFDLEDAKFFMTIYLDPILGLLFAFLAYLAITQDDRIWDRFQWVVAGSFLILTKEMGLVFYGFASLIVLMKDLKKPFYPWKWLLDKAYLVLPLMALVSWKIYFSQFNYVGQFQPGSIHLNTLIQIIQGTGGEAWQQLAYHHYLSALWTMPILELPFKINFLGMFLIFSFIAFGLGGFKSKGDRAFVRNALIVLTLLSWVYAGLMMVLYMFSFGSYEGPNLASMMRYLSTYWYAMGALVLMVWVSHSKSSFWVLNVKLMVTIAVVLVFMYGERNFMRIRPDFTTDDFEAYFTTDTQKIRTMTDDDSHIYLIAQNQSANILNIFRYMMNDRVFNTSGFDIGQPEGVDDVWKTDMTQAQFIQALEGYDYLYIYTMDNVFYEKFFTLFPIDFYVQDHQLIKIHREDGFLSFTIVD